MSLHAIVIGSGLLGSGMVDEVLCSARFASRLASLNIIDPSEVRRLTLIASPQFAGFLEHPKAEAAAELARRRLGGLPQIRAHRAYVQGVDLGELLETLPAAREDLVVIVLTPDSWPARVDALWQLRMAHGATPGRIVVVQMGVDRSLVQASVFANGFRDPCVVCGLASPTLPTSEPCVVLKPEGRLLRGTLRAERQAAVALFGDILDDLMAGRLGVVNRKTVLRLDESTAAVERFDHGLERRADCWGPHDPQRAPLRLDQLLQT